MLRGALLGAGNIAQFGHIPAYMRSPDLRGRCQLVAATDLSQKNLARVSALLPGIETYTSAAELFARVRPDFVDICAPPYAHRQLVELAIDYGCHILCEKPLSLSLADAEMLASCLHDADLVFMPGHQYHYAPTWQAVRDAIKAGAIGTPWFGVVSIQRTQANEGSRHWNPTWRTIEALSGGGILMDHGTHLFYQLQAVFGHPHQVAAKAETRRHLSYGVEDTVCCYLDFGAACVRIMLTWAAGQRRTTHRYLGTDGEVLCDESMIRVTSASGSRTIDAGEGFSANSHHSAWYTPLFRDFLDRIERCDFDRGPLDEAVATIRLTAAAYESARTGRPVRIGP